MPVPFLLRTKEFRLKEILRGRYVVISAKFRLNNICRRPSPPPENLLPLRVAGANFNWLCYRFHVESYDSFLLGLRSVADCGNLKYTKIRWFVISLSSDPLINSKFIRWTRCCEDVFIQEIAAAELRFLLCLLQYGYFRSISGTDWHTGSIPEMTCFIDEALLSVTITNPQGHCVLRLASANICSLSIVPHLSVSCDVCYVPLSTMLRIGHLELVLSVYFSDTPTVTELDWQSSVFLCVFF